MASFRHSSAPPRRNAAQGMKLHIMIPSTGRLGPCDMDADLYFRIRNIAGTVILESPLAQSLSLERIQRSIGVEVNVKYWQVRLIVKTMTEPLTSRLLRILLHKARQRGQHLDATCLLMPLEECADIKQGTCQLCNTVGPCFFTSTDFNDNFEPMIAVCSRCGGNPLNKFESD